MAMLPEQHFPPDPPDKEIDRKSVTPYYHQLKHLLAMRIQEEGLVGGDRLWSEHELCERYGVSRSVVRQTLSELEAEGIIERARGKGTFLAHPKVDEGLVRSVSGLFEDAKQRGSTVVSEVLRQEIVPASDAVARLLELPLATDVVVVERLRAIDGEPWVHTTTWLPADRVPGLVTTDLRTQSLYQLLRDTYGITFGQARRSLEAASARTETAALLGVPEGSPVLVLRSLLRDSQNRPLETFVAFHRGDRSRFDVVVGAAVESAQVRIT